MTKRRGRSVASCWPTVPEPGQPLGAGTGADPDAAAQARRFLARSLCWERRLDALRHARAHRRAA